MDAGHNSETITHKLMVCGVMVRGTVFSLPNYWPNHQIKQTNDAIWSLPVKFRNYFVNKYILNIKKPQILAKGSEVSTRTVWNWENTNYEPYKQLLILLKS